MRDTRVFNLCVRWSRIRDRRNLTHAYDGHESVTHRVRQENTAVTNSGQVLSRSVVIVTERVAR